MDNGGLARVNVLLDCALTLILVDFFQSLQEKTGYPAAWFFLAMCGVMIAALTLLGGAKLLVDVVGFVYPAYMSFKSIDGSSSSSSSSSTTDSTIKRAEETQWLTYWVCFAFMSLLETVFGFLTRLVPLYYWLKLAIVVVRIYQTRATMTTTTTRDQGILCRCSRAVVCCHCLRLFVCYSNATVDVVS
jgi:TB2/DP1, HVA22 family